MEPSANEVFGGRYRFVDPLGAGGMGSVWRVWDHRTGRYLAAKVLREQDASALLRFVREQSLRVRHPHVVAPLGWAADDERVLLTMELVRGGSVHGLVRDHGALPAGFASVLLDQLLSALQAVHDKGIVHRDVKPANLLLEATGRARPALRLADFGIATTTDEPRLTRTGMLVGTPGYVAPEVLRGAEPEPRQDLYLVGLVAAEMLTGSRGGAGAQHPPDVPAPVWAVVSRLSAEAPQDRPSTAEAARRELARAVANLTVPGPDRAHPDAVEVFDQVAPLPVGFGPDGPLDVGDPGARATRPVPGATVPVPPPTRRDPGAPDEAPDQAPDERGSRRAGGPTGSDPPNRSSARGADRSDPASAPGSTRRRVLLGGTAVVALGIGLLLVAFALVRGAPGRDVGGGPATPGSSSSGTSTPGPGTAARSTARSSPSVTVPSIPPSPRGTLGGTVRVGEPCGVVEGLTDTTPDGALVTCRRADGGGLTWQTG